MALASGARLGPYEILAPLGAGGMGEVYRAHDTRLGRHIAIKVLPASTAADPRQRARFEREAHTIAALNHPNIVTIHSVEAADGVEFLTMELIEGMPVTEMIVGGGLPLERILALAIPLADAVSAAHQKGITHRDLKPANVMVTADGRVKVLDFGLATDAGPLGGEHGEGATRARLTHDGTIVGTIPYMSPEQLEGRPVDPRSDLFSLGVMLHEMLTGTRPFGGASAAAVMSAILRDPPPSIPDQRADVPEPLAQLVTRCLEKRPDDRIQTARDVCNELRRVQKQLESGTSLRVEMDHGPSVAVLPFTDLSPAKDQEWFCDGIAEEILNALSPLAGLRVAARASAFSFRGRTDDLRTIGEKLNVATVLEGSVRRAGNRVRITAQLSDAQKGYQLWSERYDRELKDIFDVQDEIARALVERLKVTWADGGRGRLVATPTRNLDAYELLLKGRVLQTRRGRSILDAMGHFEQAIALDPNLAEAHALLGDAHRLTALYGLVPASEAMPLARAASERALGLDPRQVEALATLANIAAVYDWDLPGAAALSARALASDPSHVRTLAERAIVLAIMESPPPELEQRLRKDTRRASTLDPLNAWALSVEGMVLEFMNQPEQGVALAQRAVALDDQNFTARWTLVSSLACCGRHREALGAAEAALAMSGRHPRILTEVAGSHAALGDLDGAEAAYRELRSRARTSYVGAAEQAAAAASADHADEARTLVSQAIAAREPYLVFWKLPAWRAFWQDPECAALLHGTGLMTRPDAPLF